MVEPMSAIQSFSLILASLLSLSLGLLAKRLLLRRARR